MLTFDYHLCCKASKKTICLVKKSWYMLCNPLLGTKLIHWSVLGIVLLILIVNILCFMLIHIDSQSHKCFKSIIKSINNVNVLSGIHMLIIWVSNLIYGDEVFAFDTKWQSGPIYFTLFVLDLSFKIISPLLLSILSFSRLMVVLYPLKSKYKEIKFVHQQIGSIIIFGIGLQVYPLVYVHHFSIQ